MITIQQTVNIPSDRRLVLELPQTVPSGRVNVCIVVDTFAEQAASASKNAPASAMDDAVSSMLSHTFPTIEELKAEAARKTEERLADPSRDSLNRYAGCLAESKIFEGDAVAIQREMRDEWN